VALSFPFKDLLQLKCVPCSSFLPTQGLKPESVPSLGIRGPEASGSKLSKSGGFSETMPASVATSETLLFLRSFPLRPVSLRRGRFFLYGHPVNIVPLPLSALYEVRRRILLFYFFFGGYFTFDTIGNTSGSSNNFFFPKPRSIVVSQEKPFYLKRNLPPTQVDPRSVLSPPLSGTRPFPFTSGEGFFF